MPELKRRFVIPGEVVARGSLRAETNVIRVGDNLVSTRVGMAEIAHDAVRVVPLSGPYIPRIDDLVVGKIIDYSAFAWEADINRGPWIIFQQKCRFESFSHDFGNFNFTT